MRDKFDRLREKKAIFFILLALGLLAWAAACSPSAGSDTPTPLPKTYSLYLHDWTKDEGYVPVNSQTLQDLPGGRRLEAGTLSADGSTGIIQEYTRGRASIDPEHIWVVVYDLASGEERNRFHPPAKGFVGGLSADGARLLMRPDPFPATNYPPTVEWYLVDTTNGKTLAHIEDADNACYRQFGLLDPAGQRIYCTVDPDLEESEGPQPLQVVAYDVESGEIAAQVRLPEALIGGKQIEDGGLPVEEFLEPGLALSRDGSQLAIVHAEADKVTLLDAQELAIERTFSLERSVTLGELLSPPVAHAKGEMSGTIRQAKFSLDGSLLYVFSQEIVATGEEPPEERGLWLVDLERGLIRAEALPDYQIQWVAPAPDGSVYAFGTTDERLWPYQIRETSPSTLWRLDGRTLAIQAERDFTGYRGGRLVLGMAAAPETAATKSQDADCPVTRPPESPFIPPEPWPEKPPGPDQFWYGDGDLWTALPASGSWRQLALGEKFWWWSEAFDVAEDETPDLKVTARRLDGNSPPFQTVEATNGYHPSFHWAMLIGVDLASSGCWEFTGEYQGHQLSFILWVPSE